jgi:urate oxidase
MRLSSSTYGKGRVRIMRVKRDTSRHEVRELTVKVLLEGDFGDSFTSSDNSKVIATDTIKNIVNIVARDQLGTETEPFADALADYFFEHYAHVTKVNVTTAETKWERLLIAGAPHDHAFKLDSNGQPSVRLTATRGKLYVPEIHRIRLVQLSDGRRDNIEGNHRPDFLDRNERLLGLDRHAARLSDRQRQNPGHNDGGVRHDLQPQCPEQPVPHG